jgi:hypothetical protein
MDKNPDSGVITKWLSTRQIKDFQSQRTPTSPGIFAGENVEFFCVKGALVQFIHAPLF